MPRQTLRFRRAYQLADRIVRLVEERDPEEYIEDHLEVEDPSFVEIITRPHKQTILHLLIESVLSNDLDYSTGHLAEELIGDYMAILEAADIQAPCWLTEDHVSDHISELDKLLIKAVPSVANATFHLLFSDREFLVDFNDLIASYVGALRVSDMPALLESDGILARPKYLPSWLRTAVFMRDKGRCQVCHTDLTGTMSIPNAVLDHAYSNEFVH